MIPEICPTCLQEIQPLKVTRHGGANDILVRIDRYDMTTPDAVIKAAVLLNDAAEELKRLRDQMQKPLKESKFDGGVVDVVHRLEECNGQKPQEAVALMREASVWIKALVRYIEEH